MGLFTDLVGTLPEPIPEIKPDTPHYEALGRFITSYANAETAVHLLARHLSGLSDEKSRFIFGGMRLPDLCDTIRHFMKLDGLPEEKQIEVDACLTQLILIGKRRHTLVHRSSHIVFGTLTVTNVLTTKSLNAIETDFFEAKQLSDMQSDCGRVYLRLDRISDPARNRDDDHPGLMPWLQRPWQYKYVPPKTPNLKPRAKFAKPTIQLPSSRGKPERQD